VTLNHYIQGHCSKSMQSVIE